VTRTCTLCGAPVDVELWQAEHVCYPAEHLVLTVPARGVALARCSSATCRHLELLDIDR
jgi:hypothetical protein